MINRILGSLFMGFIFISILDFLYFIGLKLNYFDLYKIDVYFNVLFYDSQNFYILIPLALVVGYMLMYSAFAKPFMKAYIIIIILSTTTLYEPIGRSLGETIFLKENQRFKFGSTTFSGATLYEGRRDIYIYRQELLKTVKLPIYEVKNITIE
ncbi:MAG TPA: hypothetical protein EYG93_04190 [Sulfurospirillum arcachonense]|nr:hypothetical protein [Sulfurospirillum arcachonense]HIP44518.1 hypothetical protein [Sulfurospirillum arcachonense]